MTVKELIEKLHTFKADAVVTVQLLEYISEENKQAEIEVNGSYIQESYDGFVKDAVDISNETENGNTICIIAEQPQQE